MRASNYTICVGLPGSRDYMLMHGYTVAIDEDRFARTSKNVGVK
jgi:hypothetical protein